jgi:hypothetical protein
MRTKCFPENMENKAQMTLRCENNAEIDRRKIRFEDTNGVN